MENLANMRRIASDKAAQVKRSMQRETRSANSGGEISVRYRWLFWLACGALGVLGFVWGSFAVLLADLSRLLDILPGPLGLALSGGMIASFPVMALAGRVADLVGRRPLLIISGALMGIGFAWLAFVGSYASLFVALLVLSAILLALLERVPERLLRTMLREFGNGEDMGRHLEKVLEEAVLEKVERMLEEASRSKEILDSKEAAEFLRLPYSTFKQIAPSLPRHPVTEQRFVYHRRELIEWVLARR
jgi:hypothetical protein